MTTASCTTCARGRHVPSLKLGTWLVALLLAGCGQAEPEPTALGSTALEQDERTDRSATDTAPDEPSDHDGEEVQGEQADDVEQATAAASTQAADTGPIAEPAQVSIPAIGVNSSLVYLGIDDDRRMEVPQGDEFDNAGWYRLGPRPGENGPAIVAGHVDNANGPSVFFELDQLEPGDEVEITDHDGVIRRFEVDRTEQYDKYDFPTDEVYGDTDGPELRLITCGGPFDQAERSYEENVVVYASQLD